jgi:hypothetical protein
MCAVQQMRRRCLVHSFWCPIPVRQVLPHQYKHKLTCTRRHTHAISVHIARDPRADVLELSLGRVQVDNQLPGTPFPVMLSPIQVPTDV